MSLFFICINNGETLIVPFDWLVYRAEFHWVLQVLDFVSRYLPAYKAYLPTLYLEGPNGSDPKHLLVVQIDEERNPILSS